MKFRDEEGCDCVFAFILINNDGQVRDSQLEKEFEEMLGDAVDLLGMQYDQRCSAYIMNEEQAQYLCGASAGFCFAVNRRMISGYCFAPLHGC